MSNRQEIERPTNQDKVTNPALQGETASSFQEDADLYLSMLMDQHFSPHQLLPCLQRIELAIARLEEGEVTSEYTSEQLKERLHNINFSRMALRNPDRN